VTAVVAVAGEEHKERDTFIGEGAAALVNNPPLEKVFLAATEEGEMEIAVGQ